ncbi:MAG: 50S ribosomal protein L24 [Bacteroidota bacterium]
MQKKKNSHRTTKLHIRKGDTVQVLSGNYKGKQSTVLKVLPHAYKAVVANINEVTRHRKPTPQNPQGGVETIEAPIHLSNLMLVDPATSQATRTGRKPNEAGKLTRYSKKTGNIINNG